jgi:hypothetical protein
MERLPYITGEKHGRLGDTWRSKTNPVAESDG